MKTIMLAAAAALALGIGSTAHAGEGDGQSAVTAEWLAANGVHQVPATEWFVQRDHQAPQAREIDTGAKQIQAGNG